MDAKGEVGYRAFAAGAAPRLNSFDRKEERTRRKTMHLFIPGPFRLVLEQGEVRHYNYLAEKIRLVADLYDREKIRAFEKLLRQENPLTPGNKLGPPVT
jgi:hypothetical protein